MCTKVEKEAIRKTIQNIKQLSSMVNNYAKQLELGKKVHGDGEDFYEHLTKILAKDDEKLTERE